MIWNSGLSRGIFHQGCGGVFRGFPAAASSCTVALVVLPARSAPEHPSTPRPSVYSLRKASTGSLRLALEAGSRPATKVRNTLMSTRMTAAPKGRNAMFGTPITA